jgi:general secretion pathway protein D
MFKLAYPALLLFLLIFGWSPAWSTSHFQIQGVRFGWHDTYARLVFDLHQDSPYRLRIGPDPARILVEFPGVSSLPSQSVWPAQNPLIREVRFRKDTANLIADIRLVSPGTVRKHFRLGAPGRLVIDLARYSPSASEPQTVSAQTSPSPEPPASESVTHSDPRLSTPQPVSTLAEAPSETPARQRQRTLAAGAGSGPDVSPALSAATNPTPNPAHRQAAGGKAAAGTPIHLNFKNADILQIINLISDITGKNFLVDEKVRGKVTIVAPRPVSLEEAYQVFLSILEIKGFTVVPQGPLVKILPAQGVKQFPLPTAIDGPPTASDEFITQLIPLEFADANEVRTLLSTLVSKESSLLAYPPTNTLIVTEKASNISRLLKIIHALDIETASVFYKVIPLQYAAAEEMAKSLQTAMGSLSHARGPEGEKPAPKAGDGRGKPTPASGSTGKPKTPTKILADSRTNSLVVIASPGAMAIAQDLIAKLDVPTPEGQGQIHVYYLDHIDAEELAQVLIGQAEDIARVAEGRDAQQSGAKPGPKTALAGGVVSPRTGTTATGISIAAHQPTNSLIITAPREAYGLIKGIIEKLDIRRSQVLVESLIAEVTFNQAEAFGVEWRLLDDPDEGTQVFSSSLGAGEASLLNTVTSSPLASPPGLVIGVLRKTITINGQEVFDIPAVLRAMQSSSDANVLAMPNLLTTDNEEAKIVIGEERPFLQATTETPSGGVISTSRSFEFRDTGITLRVKPKISQSKTVHLDLFLEITNFIGEAETGAVTTTKRSAETSVIIDDGQTIVVGGLIRDDESQIESTVPCLGNLPVFGWLFRQTSERKIKTNLLIFMTPHIITTADEGRRITEHKRQQSEKADELKEQLQKSRPQENLELLLD